MLLGLLVYEMATQKRPFEDVYSLNTVALSLLHGNTQLNVEADHFLQKKAQDKVYTIKYCSIILFSRAKPFTSQR